MCFENKEHFCSLAFPSSGKVNGPWIWIMFQAWCMSSLSVNMPSCRVPLSTVWFKLNSWFFHFLCGSIETYHLIPFFCLPFYMTLYFPSRPYGQGGFIQISTLRARRRVWYVFTPSSPFFLLNVWYLMTGSLMAS